MPPAHEDPEPAAGDNRNQASPFADTAWSNPPTPAGTKDHRANISKRRTRLANLIATPPRPGHADRTRNVLSTGTTAAGDAVQSNGRDTSRCPAPVVTNSSSSSEWTDDDVFLKNRLRRRFPSLNRTPKKARDTNMGVPLSAPVKSQAPAATARLLSSPGPGTSKTAKNKSARFLDFRRTQASKTTTVGSEDKASLISTDSSSELLQLSPLSPNVELYRGSARHRAHYQHGKHSAYGKEDVLHDLGSDEDEDSDVSDPFAGLQAAASSSPIRTKSMISS